MFTCKHVDALIPLVIALSVSVCTMKTSAKSIVSKVRDMSMHHDKHHGIPCVAARAPNGDVPGVPQCYTVTEAWRKDIREHSVSRPPTAACSSHQAARCTASGRMACDVGHDLEMCRPSIRRPLS